MSRAPCPSPASVVEAVVGGVTGAAVGAGTRACKSTGSTITSPDCAPRMGLKVPASKSYTQIVYSGGAKVTVAPVVLPLVQTLVVDGVGEARTRQGAQLPSILFVPSYSGYTEPKRPPSEGLSGSVVTPSMVALT